MVFCELISWIRYKYVAAITSAESSAAIDNAFKEMKAAGIRPSLRHYNAALARAGACEQLILNARRRSHVLGSSPAVLQSLPTAQAYFDAIAAAGLKPDVASFTELLRALARSQRMARSPKMQGAGEKNRGNTEPSTSRASTGALSEASSGTVEALRAATEARALKRAATGVEVVELIRAEMAALRVDPDVRSYTATIQVDGGEPSISRVFHSDLKSSGVGKFWCVACCLSPLARDAGIALHRSQLVRCNCCHGRVRGEGTQ